MDHSSYLSEEGEDRPQRSKAQVEELFLNGSSRLPFSGNRRNEKREGTKHKHIRVSWGNSHLHFFFHYTVTQMMFTKINLAMTTDEDKSSRCCSHLSTR